MNSAPLKRQAMRGMKCPGRGIGKIANLRRSNCPGVGVGMGQAV